MLRNLAFVVGYAVILVLSATASVWAADFGKPLLSQAWPWLPLQFAD
jgi:hypothetical protein